MTLLRYLWAAPNTFLALGCAGMLVGSDAETRVVDGVLEVYGGAVKRVLSWLPPPGGAAAVTLGHVVFGVSAAVLDGVRDHEHVHVRQYERWGPLFLPAYGLLSIVARLSGGDAYHDNAFEREARELSDG